jgi:hypothetical protein
MANLYSPKGVLIAGTLEKVYGTGLITLGTAERLEDGTIDFEWAGETKMNWDSSSTEMSLDNKERIFVCDDGQEWRESQLLLLTDEEFEERFAEPEDEPKAADLLAAAKDVLANWERGDLAAAVRKLDAAVKTMEG